MVLLEDKDAALLLANHTQLSCYLFKNLLRSVTNNTLWQNRMLPEGARCGTYELRGL
jgi:hypothetical protein